MCAPICIAAYRQADPAVRLPWFGPAMSPASSVTARLMETWAHGQDILDTVGATREPTGALRHVADLGIRARRYAYTVNGLGIPAAPVRVELDGPDGARWAWGPEGAANRVTGTALDFCLLVTQRRHRDDTALTVTGAAARQWMSIAQAFAGPAWPRASPVRGARPWRKLTCLNPPVPAARSGSATPPGSTATAWRPPGRWSRAVPSTCSPVTTWPS